MRITFALLVLRFHVPITVAQYTKLANKICDANWAQDNNDGAAADWGVTLSFCKSKCLAMSNCNGISYTHAGLGDQCVTCTGDANTWWAWQGIRDAVGLRTSSEWDYHSKAPGEIVMHHLRQNRLGSRTSTATCTATSRALKVECNGCWLMFLSPTTPSCELRRRLGILDHVLSAVWRWLTVADIFYHEASHQRWLRMPSQQWAAAKPGVQH